MRYLLVGNGPTNDVGVKAKHADAVIQINDCQHNDQAIAEKTRYIFVSNSGDTSLPLLDHILRHKYSFPNAQIICARNPLYYTVKKWLLRLRGNSLVPNYEILPAWERLTGRIFVSFLQTMRLEFKLRKHGMAPSLMPSTGMIAYHWLCQRLEPADSLDLVGFTFEGWEHHPWDIERKLVKGIYYPGYRDDPSYEKRMVY